MKKKELTVEVHAEWPEEERQELMSKAEELARLIEKANALADALASRLKEIEIKFI